MRATPAETFGSPSLKQQEATRLLNRAAEGELSAAAELLPMVYSELRALAESFFRNERGDHTLQPTALVHEAYMRLVDQTSIAWRSRQQFFSFAARAMRNILVDHARKRNRQKRGGDGRVEDGPAWQEVTLCAIENTIEDAGAARTIDILALDEALERLARMDERKAQIVELRFFAGLSEPEAADVLGITRSTASEDWRLARAWLLHELQRGDT